MKLPLSRAALFGTLLLASIVPIYALMSEAITGLSTPDDRLLLSFEGRAFEDIFGFGFWFTWAAFLVVEALVLVAAWFISKGVGARYLALLPAGAFLIASILSYTSYQRMYELYSQPNSRLEGDAIVPALRASARAPQPER